MLAVRLGAAQAAHPAAGGNEVSHGPAHGVQRGPRRRIRRPLAHIGAVLRRRRVRVRPQGLVQTGDLGGDGAAVIQVAQVIGIALGLQQDRRDHLATQIQVVQRRRHRIAQPGPHLFGPAARRGAGVAASQDQGRGDDGKSKRTHAPLDHEPAAQAKPYACTPRPGG
ncbi:hypothetical protein D3C80_1335220 [compost metagenome]